MGETCLHLSAAGSVAGVLDAADPGMGAGSVAGVLDAADQFEFLSPTPHIPYLISWILFG